MKFRSEETPVDHLLVFGAERGVQDPIFEKMVMRSHIEGILVPEIRELAGGEIEYVFRITGLRSIRSMEEVRDYSGTDIMAVMRQIASLIERLRDYLIDPEYLVLRAEYLYQDEGSGKICLLFAPEKSDSLMPALQDLMNDFLRCMVHDNSADMQRVYLLYGELRKDHASLISAVEAADSGQIEAPPRIREKSVRYSAPAQQEQPARTSGVQNQSVFEVSEKDKKKKDTKTDRKEKKRGGLFSGFGKKKEKKEKKKRQEKTVQPVREEEAPPEAHYGYDPYSWNRKPDAEKAYEASYGGEETVFLGDTGGPGAGSMSQEHIFHLIPVQSGAEEMIIRYCPSVIGKGMDCDLRIPAPTVSRQHAEFRKRGESLFLADLHSTNGTWVNGMRISEETEVRSGDRIRFADREYDLD